MEKEYIVSKIMMRLELLISVLFLVSNVQGNKQPADVILVGAGTSGCALAARLCALRPSHTFLLLERAEPRNLSQFFFARSPRLMWDAWESPQVVDFIPAVPTNATNNRPLVVFGGNTLGGTSAINGRQWVVPLRGTVEKWRIQQLTTDKSRLFYKRAFRKVGFMPQTGDLRYIHAEEYVNAAVKAGFPLNRDPFDDRTQRSIFENHVAVDKKGFNIDSCRAYLTPTLNGACKNNLRLMQGITVSRVLLNNHRQAVGVEYIPTAEGKMGRKRTLRAKREVLLTAGPFGSARLLQLSGIGPGDVLRQAGVPLKVELPVGERTQSRPLVLITSMYSARLEPSNNSTLINSEAERQRWLNGGGGVYGKLPSFCNGREGTNGYTAAVGSFSTSQLDKKWLVSGCFINPNSVGYLRIRDANVFTNPEVDLAFLKEKIDILRMKRCLRKIIRIHQNFPPSYNMRLISPPRGRITEQFIRNTAQWPGHFVGGCEIGTVVRPNLKVKKVRGLRVVDSSVLRSIPTSSGPMASVYMLAEYAAELIAKDLE